MFFCISIKTLKLCIKRLLLYGYGYRVQYKNFHGVWHWRRDECSVFHLPPTSILMEDLSIHRRSHKELNCCQTKQCVIYYRIVYCSGCWLEIGQFFVCVNSTYQYFRDCNKTNHFCIILHLCVCVCFHSQLSVIRFRLHKWLFKLPIKKF